MGNGIINNLKSGVDASLFSSALNFWINLALAIMTIISLVIVLVSYYKSDKQEDQEFKLSSIYRKFYYILIPIVLVALFYAAEGIFFSLQSTIVVDELIRSIGIGLIAWSLLILVIARVIQLWTKRTKLHRYLTWPTISLFLMGVVVTLAGDAYGNYLLRSIGSVYIVNMVAAIIGMVAIISSLSYLGYVGLGKAKNNPKFKFEATVFVYFTYALAFIVALVGSVWNTYNVASSSAGVVSIISYCILIVGYLVIFLAIDYLTLEKVKSNSSLFMKKNKNKVDGDLVYTAQIDKDLVYTAQLEKYNNDRRNGTIDTESTVESHRVEKLEDTVERLESVIEKMSQENKELHLRQTKEIDNMRQRSENISETKKEIEELERLRLINDKLMEENEKQRSIIQHTSIRDYQQLEQMQSVNQQEVKNYKEKVAKLEDDLEFLNDRLKTAIDFIQRKEKKKHDLEKLTSMNQ